MIVGVLTTCHTQYTWDSSICIFLFNRTTLQGFVTYLTGALYVHPLWFYKHQHDNRVRSKLFVACQPWWFQWRFWFVPSFPGNKRTLSLETVHTTFEWNCQMAVVSRIWCALPLDNCTPTIILNNPAYIYIYTGCPRRKGPNFGRAFLRSNYNDIIQNTYIQSSMVTEILAREVWNFDSYYSLIDYQIHIETGRNMWFL